MKSIFSIRFVFASFLFLFWIFGSSEGIYADSESLLMGQVVKVKTYMYNAQTESYISTQYGSAVAIAKNRIITNAHVILDSETKNPTWLYEICVSVSYQSLPRCITTARLISYDPIADLALLELKSPLSTKPVELSSGWLAPLSIGQTAVIYGFPTIGGETITRTEWKIAWYQNPVYKIDASIDHGNSGGWAFDGSGNFIGIPYAVSSDNGVIGYMISRKMIRDFLQRETVGYKTFLHREDAKFVQYISRNHAQMRQWGYLHLGDLWLKNLPNSWFHLVDTAIDSDNNIASWILRDGYGRVSVYIGCTRDAGKLFGYEMDKITLDDTRRNSSDYLFSDDFFGNKNEFYRIRATPRNPRNDGSQEYIDTWYYRNHDDCFAQVYSTDTIQDKNLIVRAEKLIQSAKFQKPYTLPIYQGNPYFHITSIPEYVRSSYFIDIDGSKKVSLEFLIGSGRSIEWRIQGEKYTSLLDYFTEPFYSVESYSGSLDMASLREEFARNIENTQVQFFTSKNGKRMIFSYNIDTEKKTTINIYYPYTLWGEYYAWYWTKSFSNWSLEHIQKIRYFLSCLDLPGQEALP